jgi:hypothetical protein
MPTPTPNQLRPMLAQVKADLSRETNLDRASDLRVLRITLETAIALAAKQSVLLAAGCASPGATIH